MKCSRKKLKLKLVGFKCKCYNIGQGEARHRKYKRLEFGGGQQYDCSND
jgi:hypothetical protein